MDYILFYKRTANSHKQQVQEKRQAVIAKKIRLRRAANGHVREILGRMIAQLCGWTKKMLKVAIFLIRVQKEDGMCCC